MRDADEEELEEREHALRLEAARLVERERALEVSLAAMNAVLWCAMQDRFHGFDAIKDDACPSCGGPVTVERIAAGAPGQPEGVRLRSRYLD